MNEEQGTLGQRKRAADLIRLARDEFGRLLPGEVKMLRGAAMGMGADLIKQGDEELVWDTEKKVGSEWGCWETWGEHRMVRAVVLRWVCSLMDAKALVDPIGVILRHALIQGKLDLDGAVVPFRVGLFGCAIPGGMSAIDARLHVLALNGSVVSGILANRVNVTGDILMCKGFRAFDMVELIDATIGGSLNCSGGQFEGINEMAINADGIKVVMNVILRQGFCALGEVRLAGAKIGGSLDFSGGEFGKQKGEAIQLYQVSVDDTIYFGDMKVRTGVVALIRAKTDYMVDDLAVWPEQIRLTGFRYSAIFPDSIGSVEGRLEWLAKSDQTCKPRGLSSVGYLPDPQPYRQLAKVLREQGHEDDARKIMKECARRRSLARIRNWIVLFMSQVSGILRGLRAGMKWLSMEKHRRDRITKKHASLLQRHRRQFLRLPFSCTRHVITALFGGLLLLLYEAIAGHGYNRWRPIAWMLCIIVFGGFIFSGYRTGEFSGDANPNPTKMQQTQGLVIKNSKDIKETWVKDYPVFRPLAYSADAFLPLVNLHQESYWTPKDGWVKSFYLPFHILAGWIVTTLAAVSVTGLVRHEKE